MEKIETCLNANDSSTYFAKKSLCRQGPKYEHSVHILRISSVLSFFLEGTVPAEVSCFHDYD